MMLLLIRVGCFITLCSRQYNHVASRCSSLCLYRYSSSLRKHTFTT